MVFAWTTANFDSSANDGAVLWLPMKMKRQPLMQQQNHLGKSCHT